MVETQDQPVNPEQEAPSKIAEKFASARDAVMNEAAELKQIYKSVKEPGVKDVYNSWVQNMDVVANSMSLGREKPRLRTKIMKVTNRIVGVGSAALTGALDFVPDLLTWAPRKIPVIRHFIPHDVFKKHSMRMAEGAKVQALVGETIGGGLLKVADTVTGVGVGLVDRSFLGAGPLSGAETRAAGKYIGNKINNVTEAIMHPKVKARA